MADTVIKIENLYKEYRLGVIGHGTLYRDLQSWWARIRQKEDPNTLIGYENRIIKNENILALNNINLEINKGEILGIIGANGAGKSTLLKILSRVTTPTSGLIKIKGKIASLLEVGTGFHTELTGRENIYLNGSINGMGRNEINNNFDEIVQFAGVEQFIDTPVKRYSSGMYVRLGFAVAAYLDPEILVVDEVLAVGDIEFQKKAIGKMESVSKELNRTVLLVSHRMSTIQTLCDRAIIIDNGTIKTIGSAKDVVNEYMNLGKIGSGERKLDNHSKTNKPKGLMPGKEPIKVYLIRVLNEQEEVCTKFNVRDNIIVEIRYKIPAGNSNPNILFYFNNDRQQLVFVSFNNEMYKNGTAGIYNSRCLVPKDMLNDGQYFVSLIIHDNRSVHIRENDLVSFTVMDDMNINGSRGEWVPGKKWPDATVRPKLIWENKKE